MSKQSPYNVGKSITFINKPTAEIVTATVHPNGASSTGLISSVDGTVDVKLVGMDTTVPISVTASVKELYAIDTIYTTGSVDIGNITLFWQD